jgi:hypothetical protein
VAAGVGGLYHIRAEREKRAESAEWAEREKRRDI